ncbi:unnamed protein product [Arctia plantaginis]|uniref:PHD-type domain-containing protein n=1 Tax=Arctia plantaginis TaxID=874455 RepID=A0A8S1AFT6_ARCPL|nr:unnamed protein product [Arctia plantaginis]
MVTKKSPGIQCSKCSKWLHASCASITTEQLNTLHSTDAVNWRCRSCTGSAKPRRLSCILPDAEEEENTDTEMIDNNITQRILKDIRREVRDIMRQELQSTLQFYSDKIDEYEKKIHIYEGNLKAVENQSLEIKNKFKNMELKYDVLEQKLHAIEQSQLANYVEVCGISEKTLSRPSAIVVSLKEGCREEWLQVIKPLTITGKDIGIDDANKIYIRECLSPNTAYFLWVAKTELKQTDLCKFVWCKNGQILVRRCEKGKTHNVRSVKDIQRYVAEFRSSKGELKMIDGSTTGLCALYRPPNLDRTQFVAELVRTMDQFPHKNSLIILGDMNIDLKQHSSIPNLYIDSLGEIGLETGISQFTRIDKKGECITRTCIDHIYVRSIDQQAVHTAVVNNALADHFITGCALVHNTLVNKNTQYKIVTKLDNERVRSELCKINWNLAMKYDNPTDVLNYILEKISCL